MFSLIPQFLRDPEAFFLSILNNEDVKAKATGLALSSALYLAVYGFMTGLSHSLWQALSSAVKMPLLFGATMLFCLPALYFFSLALLGTRLRMLQVTTVVLTGTSVTAFLPLGPSPVTLFFVLTSRSYGFFQMLAVIFVAISGVIGVYYLWRGMILSESSGGTMGRVLLGGWFALYAFVASQMTWRLSPIIGDPAVPFVLLQPSRDNFYVDVINAAGRVFGSDAVGSSASNTGFWLILCGLPLILIVLGFGFALGSARRAVRDDRRARSDDQRAPQPPAPAIKLTPPGETQTPAV